MSTEPLIRFQGVSLSYRSGAAELKALVRVDADIRVGGRIALVGPSGSGKTSFIHLAAGIERPTEGEVRWPSAFTSRVRPSIVALSFQGPSLLPPLTVLENVALPLMLAGIGEDEAKKVARTNLEHLGLANLAERIPEELSGGQGQRIGVARALATSPRVLLSDEPTSQQDSMTGLSFVGRVLELLPQDSAVVIATHDPAVAGLLRDQWVLSNGELLIS